MTTIAIIGGGIAGRSLLYALAKLKKVTSKIVIFESDTFAHACSIRSTAIVAPRGVSLGHSDLGDLIFKGVMTFSHHVLTAHPVGVYPITQVSCASNKWDQFKVRYPQSVEDKNILNFSFSSSLLMVTEDAYLIDPSLYLNWLLEQSKSPQVEYKNDFVTSYVEHDGFVEIQTQSGEYFKFDQVIFAGGVYNRFWNHSPAAKAVRGSYLEFSGIDFGLDSFSLTLDGDNLVYHAHTQKVLIGSTSHEGVHECENEGELKMIFHRIFQKVNLVPPRFESALVRTGLREKASKRRPYIYQKGRIACLGGLYKNGFSLSLHLAQELISGPWPNDDR